MTTAETTNKSQLKNSWYPIKCLRVSTDNSFNQKQASILHTTYTLCERRRSLRKCYDKHWCLYIEQRKQACMQFNVQVTGLPTKQTSAKNKINNGKISGP